MGCILSFCQRRKNSNEDFEKENGAFHALIVSDDHLPPIIATDGSDGIIPLFAPAPSDEDIIMSSSSKTEEDEIENANHPNMQ